MTTLFYLVEKEFKQMLRSIILPVVFLILPVAMLNVIPRIATQEVSNVNVAVVDNDHSTTSSRLIQKVAASRYFRLIDTPPTYSQAEEHMKTGDADIIMELSPQLERRLYREGQADILVSANAVNGTKAALGASYLTQIVSMFNSEEGAAASIAGNSATGVRRLEASASTVAPRFLYNPTLDYKVYMIPAIIAMLITLLIGFLPALNIVMEKEHGTIEQINVTPISRLQFILSKVIPYWVVGLFLLLLAMQMGNVFHGVKPEGSLSTILVLTSLYVVVATALGLIVSNYSNTIQQAALITFFFLVIFLLLSGLLTPVASMPAWAKAITEVNPLRFYIEPMRMIYIKGSSLSELQPYLLRLSVMAAVAGTWAIVSYRKSQ